MSALLDRPATLGRALRRASTLLGLEAECLEVPAAWLGDEDERPRLAVLEALRTLRALDQPGAPATLVALPSPATLALVAPEGEAQFRATLQRFLRAVGELGILAGVMWDGDDGATALGGVLAHYEMTAICIRRVGDDAAVPPGALVARAMPLSELAGAMPAALGAAPFVTADGPVDPAVAPEELLAVSRAVGRRAP